MVKSFLPLSEYTNRETELMLKQFNGRIARTSYQLVDFLTQLDTFKDQPFTSKIPNLNENGDWIDNYKLNDTYTLGSLLKNSESSPTPLFIEYANGIRFVPAVYVDNRSETVYFRTRKCDLGDEQKDLSHDCIFLYGGIDLESKPNDVVVQHKPAFEKNYHVEEFAIKDWDYIIILPLFYKRKFYLMMLPEHDAAKEDPKCYITDSAITKWKNMIDNEKSERLFYTFE